mmetsp:Transcript_19759/g.18809  ORF Transcript_19759/g.18809 Transcript_19759/m.18809 type:complete len:127 (-) Transcript_19759:51-431(-)
MLEITTCRATFRQKFPLITSTVDGFPAREEGDRELMIDLKQIKFDSYDTKKKKGVVKDISPEERFMMSNMQAESCGTTIKNTYFLTVQSNFESIQCYGPPLCATTPITILPVYYPDAVVYEQPADF